MEGFWKDLPIRDWGYSMSLNGAAGPKMGFLLDFGRIPVGRASNLPCGQPSAGHRADFEAFPNRIRPKSGPEDRSLARKQYCVTYGRTLPSTSVASQRSQGCDTSRHVPCGPADRRYRGLQPAAACAVREAVPWSCSGHTNSDIPDFLIFGVQGSPRPARSVKF